MTFLQADHDLLVHGRDFLLRVEVPSFRADKKLGEWDTPENVQGLFLVLDSEIAPMSDWGMSGGGEMGCQISDPSQSCCKTNALSTILKFQDSFFCLLGKKSGHIWCARLSIARNQE